MSTEKIFDYETLAQVLSPLRDVHTSFSTGIPAVDVSLSISVHGMVDALATSFRKMTKDPIGDLVERVNEHAGTPLLGPGQGWPGVPDHITELELVHLFRAFLCEDVTVANRREYEEQFKKCHEKHRKNAYMLVVKGGVQYITHYRSAIRFGHYSRMHGRVVWELYWHPESIRLNWTERVGDSTTQVEETVTSEEFQKRERVGFARIGHVNQGDQEFRLPEFKTDPDPYTGRFLMRVTHNEYAALLCCFKHEDWVVEESPHGQRAFYVEQTRDEVDPTRGQVKFREAVLGDDGKVTRYRGIDFNMSLDTYRTIFFGDVRRFGNPERQSLFYEWKCPETGELRPRPIGK